MELQLLSLKALKHLRLYYLYLVEFSSVRYMKQFKRGRTHFDSQHCWLALPSGGCAEVGHHGRRAWRNKATHLLTARNRGKREVQGTSFRRHRPQGDILGMHVFQIGPTSESFHHPQECHQIRNPRAMSSNQESTDEVRVLTAQSSQCLSPPVVDQTFNTRAF